MENNSRKRKNFPISIPFLFYVNEKIEFRNSLQQLVEMQDSIEPYRDRCETFFLKVRNFFFLIIEFSAQIGSNAPWAWFLTDAVKTIFLWLVPFEQIFFFLTKEFSEKRTFHFLF